MFDRFTDRARKVMGLAKAEAQRQQHGKIRRESRHGGDDAPGEQADEDHAAAGPAVRQIAGEGRPNSVAPEEKRPEHAECDVREGKVRPHRGERG